MMSTCKYHLHLPSNGVAPYNKRTREKMEAMLFWKRVVYAYAAVPGTVDTGP